MSLFENIIRQMNEHFIYEIDWSTSDLDNQLRLKIIFPQNNVDKLLTSSSY